ncbi:XVIPCD domain-containing protein [Stenotrophomonas lactitubi]|uniref:XVIPCD domain-containing protein n=1 Tax=Stenotrophomonas lactitubi TaxID=2045214 RepID=UPI003207E9DA
MHKDDAERYSVTIHLAAPGTPRYGRDGEGNRLLLEPSFAGHMFLSLHRSGEPLPESVGFTLAGTKESPNRGKVDDLDVSVYDKPRFERTIEISKEQYDRILEFSADPKKHGFDMNYDFFSNACTDFAWGALNHAGMRPVGLAGEIKNYEGASRVLDNVLPVNAIPQQVKGSELDKVQWNPMPKQTFREWMFTENGEHLRNNSIAAAGTPADPSHADHTRLNQIHQQVADLGTFGAQNGNVSASLLALSKEQQFARVDDVLLGDRRGDAAPNLFIVQGDRNDPAHQRASLPADVAAQTPVAASFERIEQLAQALPQRDAQRQQEEQQLAQTHAPRMA